MPVLHPEDDESGDDAKGDQEGKPEHDAGLQLREDRPGFLQGKVGPEQGGLYKTTNGGATWELIARKGPETFGATVNPRKPDWVYLCLTESAPDCALWLSKDAGKTWKPLEGLPFKNIQRIAFDPDDDSIIYVCTFGGSVWKGPAE